MFEVRDIVGKGRGIVATCAIKAGAVVLREKPLMGLSAEFMKQYEGFTVPGPEKLLAALSHFRKQMTSEGRERFLGLHGGEACHDPRFEAMRDFARSVWSDDEPATKQQAELYARVFLVVTYNAFGGKDGVHVYEVASRFCHSCNSNCYYSFNGDEIIVRTISPVQEGEELTLDYNAERRLNPIHVRRFKWLQVKDFTCHCPRCDAEGDDTRQFQCFDPACSGRHLVCQPLNKDPIGIPGLSYTGVEYVEPHLLPCTVCQRSPPSEYQTAMFALEERWAAKGKELPSTPATPTYMVLLLPDHSGRMAPLKQNIAVPTVEKAPAQLRDLQSLQYQLCHWLGFQLGLKELLMRLALTQLRGETTHTDRVRDLVTQMDQALDTFFPLPSEAMTGYLMELLNVYLHLGDTANAERLKRKLIRMVRILNGRDTVSATERAVNAGPNMERMFEAAMSLAGRSDAPRDANIADECERLNRLRTAPGDDVVLPPVPEGCCVYCGESPKHAAMKRSRCGACKQVIYCGAACQKAHWPAHKKECNKKA